MTSKQLLASNSFIQYPKFLGYHIGVNSAIMLSALCDKDSWCEQLVEDYDGWFYYFREDIMLDTGLSESQQRSALKTLVDLDVVDTKNKGVPAKKFYNIDSDILEKLLDDAYEAYKIKTLKNCSPRVAENVTSRVVENRNSTINNNKEENNKEKTPDKPVSSKSTRRNFSRNKLSDDLHSGEEIKKQTSKKKKVSKEESCLDIIENSTYSLAVKNLLKEYFLWNYHSDNVKRIKGISDLKQKLNRLDQLIKKKNDPEKVVQCAIDNQWYGFFEPVESTEKKSSGIPKDDIIPQELHGEEVVEELKRREERYGVFL